ncbi:MAG TPA: cellulose synthase complex periplasmic endoglucanase BcsZ [Nevskiaceae bacterium]|nr:cellulose synthase complex periplasmic endoglucanase BcsZ [Nevskiaceae bacterium]
MTIIPNRLDPPMFLHQWRKFTVLAAAVLAGMVACGATSDSAWPDFDTFAGRFLQNDGRIIDITFDGKSTSESQSYGMFFALVANERERFDTILKWTSANLADNQLGARLPAWNWGKKDDGSWGVRDQNSAADSDLWIAYDLFEAARLWHEPRYADTARKLLGQIRAREVAELAGVGPLLLPGPEGFKLSGDRLRLVTSYYPPFMFRYLAAVDPQGPWLSIWNGFLPLALKACARGVAPDIFVAAPGGMVLPDSEAAPVASYDAIRVYTWAAMSGEAGAPLVKQLTPYAALIHRYGAPPEKVDPVSGRVIADQYLPLGYSGAVLPFLKAIGDEDELQRQQRRLAEAALKHRVSLGQKPNYYDEALTLFGQGWVEGRYRFDPAGRLQPRWVQ